MNPRRDIRDNRDVNDIGDIDVMELSVDLSREHFDTRLHSLRLRPGRNSKFSNQANHHDRDSSANWQVLSGHDSSQ